MNIYDIRELLNEDDKLDIYMLGFTLDSFNNSKYEGKRVTRNNSPSFGKVYKKNGEIFFKFKESYNTSIWAEKQLDTTLFFYTRDEANDEYNRRLNGYINHLEEQINFFSKEII